MQFNRHWTRIVFAVAFCAVPGFAQAQLTTDVPPIDWKAKLKFHAASAYSPTSLGFAFAWAGYLQEKDSPSEWGRDRDAYAERLGSTLAYLGVRNAMGFGLDTALHEDPRYYRAEEKGAWRRIGHVFRATILTHRDGGGETLAVWRLGSAYGASFLSDEWYPRRLNTFHEGVEQGTAQIGIDLVANLGTEFWPDVKKMFRRRQQ